MSQYVSFGVLLAVIIFLVVIFYKVMAGFMVPLFLSALLVVVFRPWHDWMIVKCKGRTQIAALLSTILIILTVLVPLLLLFLMAGLEARDVVQNMNAPGITRKIRDARKKLNLELPTAQAIRFIDQTFSELRAENDVDNIAMFQQPLYELQVEAKSLSNKHQLEWIQAETDSASPTDPASPTNSDVELGSANNQDPDPFELPNGTETMSTAEIWNVFQLQLRRLRELQNETNWSQSKDDQRRQMFYDFQAKLDLTAGVFQEFKNSLLGGRFWSRIKLMANPTEEDMTVYSENFSKFVTNQVVRFGSETAAFVGKLVLGTLIMVLGLYFFLLDGKRMIESVKGLSPLDDNHEQELVEEFARVSRAVVVATLLSALAQGLLAGIGFYFAGLDSVFLLTMLTCCMALVPFFGAASVWLPASLYLFFVSGNMGSAIGLAIYGVAIVSMADNVIKPLILHGQSNLHPLLALLSVLGGVTALGPIGILIGPMVVAFLQTLLKILQRELQTMETIESRPTPT